MCPITQLNWLPVTVQINFKFLIIKFKALPELDLSYLSEPLYSNPLRSRSRFLIQKSPELVTEPLVSLA